MALFLHTIFLYYTCTVCCLVGDIYVLYRTLSAHSLLNKGSNNNYNNNKANPSLINTVIDQPQVLERREQNDANRIISTASCCDKVF